MTDSARDRLVLALDSGDPEEARALARRLTPWFATVKVGLELWSAAGPAILDALREDGSRVFVDLKLHDIPTTVGRAARVLGRRGADFVTMHASGGVEMLRAGVEGLRAGAEDGHLPPPTALAVTVLTSEAHADAFDVLLEHARAAGCEGVVCSGFEVERARVAGLRTMVPGIRPAGAALHDQARAVTPVRAVAAGADWLVIGRAVTGAAAPEAVAQAIVDEIDAIDGAATIGGTALSG